MTWMRTFGRYRFQQMKTHIHRAKGHEAKFVYIVGLEWVAEQEDNLLLRNQLFVALTRSQAWVHLSGITEPDTPSDYLFYDEVRRGCSLVARGLSLPIGDLRNDRWWMTMRSNR